MAKFSGIPAWIETAKQNVIRSEEWMSFSKDLYDLISIYMEETGVTSFDHLSNDEKKVLVTRAQNALKSKSVSASLLAALSANLDKHFSDELSAVGAGDVRKSKKIESISDKCHHAIEAVLIRRPEMRVHFSQCINTAISHRLRTVMWSSLLINPVVKKEYLRLAETAPKKLVSKFDLEIAQKCQLVLESNATLKPLREVKAVVSVMRHLLSYHQVRSKSKSRLTDTEYLVAIPFLFSCLSSPDNPAKPKQVTAEELAKLVEQFESFWSTRPLYTRFLDTGTSFKNFVEHVVSILARIDPDLPQSLGDVFSNERFSSSSAAIDAVTRLLQPCIRCLYVSYLALPVVMYVFDQIIIGHGVENYDPLPYISAVLLHLVGKMLKSAQSWRQAENVFRSELKDLRVEPIREIVNEKRLVEDIRKPIAQKLSLDSRRFALPVAVFNDLPPWKHWYSDKLVAHFRAQLSKESNLASSKQSLTGHESHSREGTPIYEVTAERDSLIAEINLMKLELEEARRKMTEAEVAKLELEREADAEIEKLIQRIEYLKKANILTPPPLLLNASKFGLSEPEFEESTEPGLVPPPNTATTVERKETPPPQQTSASSMHSEPPVEEEVPVKREETPKPQTPGVRAEVIFTDVLERVMKGVHTLAHGTTGEREVLDNQTKADLVNIGSAYEQAKVDVLGKSVSDAQIENLPEAQKNDVTNKISKATRKRLLKMKFGKN